MSITVNHLLYIHPNKKFLFQDITFNLPAGEKAALIGNNGSGKSTLLQVIAGKLPSYSGEVICSDKPYYIPQHLGQFDEFSVAQAMGIENKVKALHAILNGDVSESNFTCLDDDWEIETKALAALEYWDLQTLDLFQSMKILSGGEKTKVFLSGIALHAPSIILFDEPSNHLDLKSREQLYHFIKSNRGTMLVVSHDRTLLNLLDLTYELTPKSIYTYGGNYDFYKIQKEEKLNALQAQLTEKEKSLRKAKKTAINTLERRQKGESRGEKANRKKCVPRIAMNTFKDQAERKTSQLKDIHEDKIGNLSKEMATLKDNIPQNKVLKMNWKQTDLHKGKVLVTAKDIRFSYPTRQLWDVPLSFQIRSGERISISGRNGAGKTTLLKLIVGELQPTEGCLTKADFQYLYVNQEYSSMIDNSLTVFEQVERYNDLHLPEHELKMLLHRFLFPIDTWGKFCRSLSGGEKMKLVFCCLFIRNDSPDLFILDEPTNNLDIESLEIITEALKEYQGTVIVISHDSSFLEEVKVERTIVPPT